MYVPMYIDVRLTLMCAQERFSPLQTQRDPKATVCTPLHITAYAVALCKLNTELSHAKL